MHPVRYTLFITCIIACQGRGLLFGQSSNATLVSTSRNVVEENVSTKDNTHEVDQFLSYSINAVPAKLSLGKLAVERGGCDEIRSFGMTMVKEEEEVAKKVKVLAAKRSIYSSLKSDVNTLNEFGALDDDKSDDFDKMFVARTITVLEKDIEMLRRATECEDRWVRLLASERLPLVEHQLAQLRFIMERSAEHDN